MLEFIKSRRSTRKFQDRPVPEELLSQVIEAGRYAPSGGNTQSTHLIVIQKPEVLDRLRELVQEGFRQKEEEPGMYPSIANAIRRSKTGDYVFHYRAPVLILTAHPKDGSNAIANCACILENMMLMANALDLGSCWINQLRWLNEDPALLSLEKELGMKEDERVFGALALGFADTPDGLPVRTPLPRKGNEVTFVR